MGDIGKWFNRNEFACNCGCGKADVSQALVDRLDQIRETMDAPLHVNSGCRCEAYNAKVGGKPDSAHTHGTAADIRIPDGATRFKFLQVAFVLFPRIGVYDSFIHVDVDAKLPQSVCWTGRG
jgi:uncharacterized protein YcbK (DUF882 family)